MSAVCTHHSSEEPRSQAFAAVAAPPAAVSSQALTAPAHNVASTNSPSTSKHSDFVEGLKYGAAGGIAGAFAKSCTAPLARLTILYQVQGFSPAAGAAGHAGGVAHPPTLRHAFLQVVRREGVAALWKGNLATILHRLPYSSINFYVYEHANKLLAKQLPPNTDFARTLAAGGLAGLVACSAAYPLDLVRTRLAAQTHGHYYNGIVPALRRIVADEGAVGLYRGLGATLLQVVPSLALNFSLYDTIRSSCMAVYNTTERQQHNRVRRRQQQLQAADLPEAAVAAVPDQQAVVQQAANGGSSSSGSRRKGILQSTGDPESLAHSMAVASTVDQGISHSQMLFAHLNDETSSTCSSSLRRAGAAAAAAEDAYNTSRASSGSSSSSAALDDGGSSGPVAAEVPAVISLASGCISGFLTATVTYPLDVVRRRMQVYGQQHHGQPVSYNQIIRQVMQQGGAKGFYFGILPEYCKVVPGVAIAFCTYEQLKKWLRAE